MTDVTDRAAAARPFAWLRALPLRTSLLAGIGAFATIAALAEATEIANVPLIIAPFGASCALVFGAPASPLAQPRNVIGGHVISAALGLLSATLIAHAPLAMAVGVGLAIAGMLLSCTLHPPAGANPIVVVLLSASWSFLLTPVLIGTMFVVGIGVLYHKLVTGHPYVLGSNR